MRKHLEIIFAALSVVFAFIAALKYFLSPGVQSEAAPGYSQKSKQLQWGSQLISEARKTSKLIFFETGAGNKSESTHEIIPFLKKSTKTGRILENCYLTAKLDGNLWPADYAVLENLLSSNAGRKLPLKTGILSPRMRPIYLDSEIVIKDTPTHPSIATILIAAANEYYRNKDKILESARNSVSLIYNPQDFKSITIESPYIPRMSFLNAESLALMAFFINPKNSEAPAAVITENARLAMRIYTTDMRQLSAKRASELAARTMLQRLKNPEISLTEKLLIMRSISEYYFVKSDSEIIGEVSQFSDFLIENQSPEGFIVLNGKSTVRHNALAAGVLARAYAITGDKKYADSARKCADRLAELQEPFGEMPAVADNSASSQSSSIEYALTVQAFCDMHYFTGDEKYINYAKRTIDEWNDFYMTPLGLWSINSENSLLSNYARPVFLEDNLCPSYIGTAAQTIAYIKNHDPNFRLPNEQKIRRMAASAFTFSPFSRISNASYKLSFFVFGNVLASRSKAPETPTGNETESVEPEEGEQDIRASLIKFNIPTF